MEGRCSSGEFVCWVVTNVEGVLRASGSAHGIQEVGCYCEECSWGFSTADGAATVECRAHVDGGGSRGGEVEAVCSGAHSEEARGGCMETERGGESLGHVGMVV